MRWLRRPRRVSAAVAVRCARKWGGPLESSKRAAADAVATNTSGCEIIANQNIKYYGMNDDFLKSFPPRRLITHDNDDDEHGDGDQDENEDEYKKDEHGDDGIDGDDDTIYNSAFSISTQMLWHNRCNYATNVQSPRRPISSSRTPRTRYNAVNSSCNF